MNIIKWRDNNISAIYKVCFVNYQEDCRFYLDEYSEQVELRKNWFEKLYLKKQTHEEFDVFVKALVLNSLWNPEKLEDLSKVWDSEWDDLLDGVDDEKDSYEHFRNRFLRRN